MQYLFLWVNMLIRPIRIDIRNWQYFEIAQAKAAGKKIIAVKLDKGNSSPSLLYGCGASWAMSFSLDSIKAAIHRAQYGW